MPFVASGAEAPSRLRVRLNLQTEGDDSDHGEKPLSEKLNPGGRWARQGGIGLRGAGASLIVLYRVRRDLPR